MKLRNRQSHLHRQVCATSPRHSWCFSIKNWMMERVKSAVWLKSNGANNTLEHDALWILLTPMYCTLLFPSHFLRTVYVWRQGKWWKYFKLRYGYLLWFSTLFHFSFLCLFFYFQKENFTCWFFFLNVIATKMYIFKNCESVIWCSLEIKRKKSFIDLIKGVNLFPAHVVLYT